MLEDGRVNRKKLGELVFNDNDKLEALNSLIHPLIFKEIENSFDDTCDLAFVDAALLIESGLYKSMDEVWLIIASRDTRINRLMLRDNIDKDRAEKIIDLQMNDEEKLKYAHEIIDNNKSMLDTYISVFKLYLKEKVAE